jgi:hypothetical protein
MVGKEEGGGKREERGGRREEGGGRREEGGGEAVPSLQEDTMQRE